MSNLYKKNKTSVSSRKKNNRHREVKYNINDKNIRSIGINP